MHFVIRGRSYCAVMDGAVQSVEDSAEHRVGRCETDSETPGPACQEGRLAIEAALVGPRHLPSLIRTCARPLFPSLPPPLSGRGSVIGGEHGSIGRLFVALPLPSFTAPLRLSCGQTQLSEGQQRRGESRERTQQHSSPPFAV